MQTTKKKRERGNLLITQYEYLSHGQSQEQEGPLSRRYLVRVLVFVFVRLVRRAGSATSVARNALFLGTIIDRSVGLVGCSRPWREWDLLPGKDDGVKLVSWAGNNDIMDNGLAEGVNVRVGRQDKRV